MSLDLGGAFRAFGSLGRDLAEQSSRASARFYLHSVVFPMFDSLAQKEKVALEEQVVNMIRRGETIGVYAERPEFKERVEDALGNPAIRLVLGKFRTHLNTPEAEIRASVPWWVDRIRETKPGLCSVISGEPNGAAWLGDTFVDLVGICRLHAN